MTRSTRGAPTAGCRAATTSPIGTTPEAIRHPFRPAIYECSADENEALARQLHDDIRSGEMTVADLAKVLTLLAPAIAPDSADRLSIERVEAALIDAVNDHIGQPGDPWAQHNDRLQAGQRSPSHPHDGYAYEGCSCTCCTNVRALQTPRSQVGDETRAANPDRTVIRFYTERVRPLKDVRATDVPRPAWTPRTLPRTTRPRATRALAGSTPREAIDNPLKLARRKLPVQLGAGPALGALDVGEAKPGSKFAQLPRSVAVLAAEPRRPSRTPPSAEGPMPAMPGPEEDREPGQSTAAGPGGLVIHFASAHLQRLLESDPQPRLRGL